jgi:hypothetical protein
MDMINKLKSRFEYEIEMSDLNKLNFFLGVHFEGDSGVHTITMHQPSYIEGVLE